MAFQSPAHSNANALQTVILLQILGKPRSRHEKIAEPVPLQPREMAELMRTWIELEYLKREIRGIPRLKPAEVGATLSRAKRALMAPQEPIEVDSSATEVADA